MSGNTQARKITPFTDSFFMCFQNFFTLDETTKYMMEKHKGMAKEEMIRRVFRLFTSGSKSDASYKEQAEARSHERKMLTQAEKWSTDQKMAVLTDRLKILPHETRGLVNTLSQLEKETLCFFISKEVQTKEGALTYARSGIHLICFHCHCYTCYAKFCLILDSLPNKNIILSIMDSIDLAEEKISVAGKKEIREQEQREAKKKAAEKKARRNKARK